ncbi:hypothetical protein B0H14DRAFT_2573209 [Mycena olivaceomarginata]|nr:hypothetical protein B0H14DRAFT_2573209 [Mycena olivaceomarginata]
MPASTESSHTKVSRFSPLAPLLSYPRKASRITLERTSNPSTDRVPCVRKFLRLSSLNNDAEESEFDFGDNYQSGTNSWAWHLPEEDEEDLSLAETWSENSAQFTPNKLDVNGFPVGGSSPPAAAQDLNCNVKIEVVSPKPDFATLEAINLTPLEQWIIERRMDFIVFATGAWSGNGGSSI